MKRPDRWFKLYSDILDDPKVQSLPPELFKSLLSDAMAGQENVFTPHLRPGADRPHASLWVKLRAFVFKRDDYTCAYCGERGKRLECDHVVPVSRGGSSGLENLVTACFRCNRSKRAKLIEEWQS